MEGEGVRVTPVHRSSGPNLKGSLELGKGFNETKRRQIPHTASTINSVVEISKHLPSLYTPRFFYLVLLRPERGALSPS